MRPRQLPVYSPLTATAIRQAVASGFGAGSNGHEKLRAALARAYDAEDVRLLASGTQALQVALCAALRAVRHDTVALPAFSCFDVAAAAIGAQARLCFYDLDPATLAPDLDSLRRALTSRGARVVVVAPLYGYPVDWEAIASVAAPCGAIMIEDAAQGHGAAWNGRPLGSLGPISVLSFGRGKGWTGGGGGALLLRRLASGPDWQALVDDLVNGHAARPIAEARVMGALAAQWALGRPATYGLPQAIPWLHLGETVYRPPTPPAPMPRSAMACLAAMWPAAEREACARRTTAAAILEALDVTGLSERRAQPIRPGAGAIPGYLRLPLRLAAGAARVRADGAARRLGIAPSYPAILPSLPAVRPRLRDVPTAWPGAEALVASLVTLPTHSLVGPAERAGLVHYLERRA